MILLASDGFRPCAGSLWHVYRGIITWYSIWRYVFFSTFDVHCAKKPFWVHCVLKQSVKQSLDQLVKLNTLPATWHHWNSAQVECSPYCLIRSSGIFLQCRITSCLLKRYDMPIKFWLMSVVSWCTSWHVFPTVKKLLVVINGPILSLNASATRPTWICSPNWVHHCACRWPSTWWC